MVWWWPYFQKYPALPSSRRARVKCIHGVKLSHHQLIGICSTPLLGYRGSIATSKTQLHSGTTEYLVASDSFSTATFWVQILPISTALNQFSSPSTAMTQIPHPAHFMHSRHQSRPMWPLMTLLMCTHYLPALATMFLNNACVCMQSSCCKDGILFSNPNIVSFISVSTPSFICVQEDLKIGSASCRERV